jgi:hypothetical protein
MKVLRDREILATIADIPCSVLERMAGRSHKPCSPVGLDDLRFLRIPHWDYAMAPSCGEMVVHRLRAAEVRDIFADLFEAQFPIERMRLIDFYDADDERSMADNNTSCYCSRTIASDAPAESFSYHAFACAIDINPLHNPQIDPSGDPAHPFATRPAAGRKYVDRSLRLPGMIYKNEACYAAFVGRGWTSGLDWTRPIDFQHFEKPL